MVQKRTIGNWGAHLNIAGEELTIEQAMLLSLGHQNARLEKMIGHLEDMRMRLHRLELFVAAMAPGYDAHMRKMLEWEEKERARAKALAEAS